VTQLQDRTTPPNRTPSARRGLLARLAIIGMESIEPVILASLISEEPLLLIGPHGTGKSYLLGRLCAALGLAWRHYNASLLNFDDLVGYPLPNGRGGLDYVQTPSSVWDAQAVFLDEISRCRPDLQNKLFPLIHERRVQGLLLDRLVYRWSAMNPPCLDDDEPGTSYRGSEPLDPALADRFAFVVAMPAWDQLSDEQQQQVILASDGPVDPEAARSLRRQVAAGKALLPGLREHLSEKLAGYVRLVAALLHKAGLTLSPRRAGMLLRNILTVHAARMLLSAGTAVRESALLALTHSLPQRATEGPAVDRIKVLAVHREAWRVAALDADDPRRVLLLEPDPLRRALWAAATPAIPAGEFSTVVADALAELPPGARHALAVELFESGAAGRLVAAIAEQAAGLYALVASPQEVRETVHADGPRHRVWQQVVATLAGLDGDDSETSLASNLLVGLFAAGQLATEADVRKVLSAWQEAREETNHRVTESTKEEHRRGQMK
jgi:MoxR-like ATPase